MTLATGQGDQQSVTFSVCPLQYQTTIGYQPLGTAYTKSSERKKKELSLETKKSTFFPLEIGIRMVGWFTAMLSRPLHIH